MNAFDRAMNLLDEKFSFLSSTKQIVSSTNEEDKVRLSSFLTQLEISQLSDNVNKDRCLKH